MENAWILLTVIFTGLISLLIYEKRKRTNHQNQLNINEKFVINENKVGKNKVITMRLSLEGKTITLVDAIKLFQPKSIRLNNKGIFEKKITDSFSYFIANLTEPGYFKDDQKIQIFENFVMKIQLAIVGIVLIAGGILFFPQTIEQLPEGSNVFSALVEDIMSIKEYNSNTEQVGDTLYDVGTEVGDKLTDVAITVEDSISDMELSPNKILNLEG